MWCSPQVGEGNIYIKWCISRCAYACNIMESNICMWRVHFLLKVGQNLKIIKLNVITWVNLRLNGMVVINLCFTHIYVFIDLLSIFKK
jgi:hypothetical protein